MVWQVLWERLPARTPASLSSPVGQVGHELARLYLPISFFVHRLNTFGLGNLYVSTFQAVERIFCLDHQRLGAPVFTVMAKMAE